jgi:hypothetical protein
MGQKYSKSEETIGWNDVKTDNMSANKIISKLSPQAVELIGLLNGVSSLSDTHSEMRVKYFFDKANNNLSEEDRKSFKELFSHIALSDTEEEQYGGTSEEYLSETSPFISSEAYESMLGQNKLIGGAKIDNDDSSTSSTSTNSELDAMVSSEDSLEEKDSLEDSLEGKKEKNSPEGKKDNKNNKEKKYIKEASPKTTKSHTESSTESPTKSNVITTESNAHSESQSAGSLDYISSSAHTDGDFSDDSSSVYKKKYDSIEDENSHLEASQHSINTSDINFV